VRLQIQIDSVKEMIIVACPSSNKAEKDLDYLHLLNSGGWDKHCVASAVDATTASFSSHSIEFDFDNANNELKHALTVPVEILDPFLMHLQSELKDRNVPSDSACQIVTCSHFSDPTLSYIDVVPFNANKGEATRFIREKFQWKDEILVCGDSGNDIAMFDMALSEEEGDEGENKVKAVIVGGAKPD